MRWPLIVVLILASSILSFILFTQFTKEDFQPFSKIITGRSISPPIDSDEEQKIKNNRELSASSGSTETKENPSAPNQPNSQNPVCQQNQISYAIKNLNQTTICNSFQGQNCNDKTIYCKTNVKNLDSSLSGTFKISFLILDNQKNKIAEQIFEKNIQAQKSKEFQSTFHFQGQDAEKKLDCSFLTKEIPSKEIC
jgi:hypothetical protein